MKIAVFGGTFDPFTVTHRAIVSGLVDMGMDKVIVAPSIVSWHREGKKPWLSHLEKEFVIRQAVKGIGGRKCSVVPYLDDLRKQYICGDDKTLVERFVTNHRYIDTLMSIIVKEGTEHEYFTVIGTDSFRIFRSWCMWKEILCFSKLIVVEGREGVKDEPGGIPAIRMHIDELYSDVSATRVREEYAPKGVGGIIEYVKVFDEKVKRGEK